MSTSSASGTRGPGSIQPDDRRLLKPAAFADDQPLNRKSSLVPIDQPYPATVVGYVEVAKRRDRPAGRQSFFERKGRRIVQRIESVALFVDEIHDRAFLTHRGPSGAVRQAHGDQQVAALERRRGMAQRAIDRDAPVVETTWLMELVLAGLDQQRYKDHDREIENRADCQATQDS